MTTLSRVHTPRHSVLSFAAWYPATALACVRARRQVTAFLQGAGLSGDVLDVAALVVDELGGNAITHHEVAPGEQVEVSVRLVGRPEQRWVVVSVRDAGPGGIHRPPGAESTDAFKHGRGLLLLRGLGVRLRGRRVGGGYLVTARFPVDEALRARVCRCDCAARGHGEGRVCRRVAPVAALEATAVPGLEAWPVCEPCLLLSIFADEDDQDDEDLAAVLTALLRNGRAC